MPPLSSRLSHAMLYSGCAAGVLGFAIMTMGGTIYEDSSHTRFLRSVGGSFGEVALALVIFAVPAVYFGRKGVLAQEEARKKPIQPPQRNAGSRLSSDNSPASETPSSLGPRG